MTRVLFAAVLVLMVGGFAKAQELQTAEPCGRDGCPDAVRLVRHEHKKMPVADGPVVVEVRQVAVVRPFHRHPLLHAAWEAMQLVHFHVHQKAMMLRAAVPGCSCGCANCNCHRPVRAFIARVRCR